MMNAPSSPETFTMTIDDGRTQAHWIRVRRVSAMRSLEEEFTSRVAASMAGATCACDTLRQTLEYCTTGVAPLPPAQYTDEQIVEAHADHEEILRDLLGQTLVMQDLLTQRGARLVELMRRKRQQELVEIFDPSIAAEELTVPSECSVAGATCSQSRRLLRMRCCSATICVECLTAHVLHNACDATAACPFCRYNFAIYRLPAAPQLTPSPPPLLMRTTNRSSLHVSPQRAF